MKVMCPNKVNMSGVEIKGKAILCFDENGEFQGVIHAKDDTQYAVYGTKSGKQRRKMSQPVPDNTGAEMNCGCQDELEGPGVPVTYDINILDCEVGDEYRLQRVHGRNGDDVTIRCKSVNFNTTQIYRGSRAAIEAQRVIGHKMDGDNGTVYEGPIEITAVHSLSKDKPWVL